MKGEGWCKEAPDESAHHPFHCVHRRPGSDDLICCWCGDLFIDDHETTGSDHGEYAAAPPTATLPIQIRHAEEAFDALRVRTNWYITRGYPVPEEVEFAYRSMGRALGKHVDERRTR